MQRVVLAPAAEEDIVEILAWCHEHFGEPARIRYEALGGAEYLHIGARL